MKQHLAEKKKKKGLLVVELCFVRPAFWLFSQHKSFLLMLTCEVTSLQQPAVIGRFRRTSQNPSRWLTWLSMVFWQCAGGHGVGLVRVLQWHNSFGRGLPRQADTHPSLGLNSCWDAVRAKWLWPNLCQSSSCLLWGEHSASSGTMGLG